jgi:hypothetical protein
MEMEMEMGMEIKCNFLSLHNINNLLLYLPNLLIDKNRNMEIFCDSKCKRRRKVKKGEYHQETIIFSRLNPNHNMNNNNINKCNINSKHLNK